MMFVSISWVGSFLLILSYFLLSTNRLNQNDWKYHTLNLCGSFMFVLYSFSINAPASMFINLVFVVIAIYSLIKITTSKYRQ